MRVNIQVNILDKAQDQQGFAATADTLISSFIPGWETSGTAHIDDSESQVKRMTDQYIGNAVTTEDDTVPLQLKQSDKQRVLPVNDNVTGLPKMTGEVMRLSDPAFGIPESTIRKIGEVSSILDVNKPFEELPERYKQSLEKPSSPTQVSPQTAETDHLLNSKPKAIQPGERLAEELLRIIDEFDLPKGNPS